MRVVNPWPDGFSPYDEKLLNPDSSVNRAYVEKFEGQHGYDCWWDDTCKMDQRCPHFSGCERAAGTVVD